METGCTKTVRSNRLLLIDMSLVLSSVTTDIGNLPPCLKTARKKKNKWIRKRKRTKKQVHWSENLVEVIQTPYEEKEPEVTTKETQHKHEICKMEDLLPQNRISNTHIPVESSSTLEDCESKVGNDSTSETLCPVYSFANMERETDTLIKSIPAKDLDGDFALTCGSLSAFSGERRRYLNQLLSCFDNLKLDRDVTPIQCS